MTRPTRLASALVLVAAAAACSAASGPDSLPDDYLGRWEYLGSSGGISGEGMGDSPTGYTVITADNTIESWSDAGELLGTGDFEVRRGRSIFSEDEVWFIVRGGLAVEQVISLYEPNGMSLSDNVHDGFQLSYARTR